MSENIYKKIEELFHAGKISEEEKERLLEAAGYKIRVFDTIEVHLRVGDLELIGKEHLNDIKFDGPSLDVHEEGKKLILKESVIPISSIRLFVPYKTNILIKSVSSDVFISSMLGFVEVHTVRGDLVIKNSSNRIVVNTISGDIHLEETYGTVNINTKSGDISISKGKINAVLKTYSGDVELENVELENSRLTTFNGDIKCTNCKFLGSNFINTYFGDVRLNGNFDGVRVKKSTTLGEIRGNINGSSSYSNELNVETKFGDIVFEGGSNG